MTYEQFLRQATNQLVAADTETPRLDVLILLEDYTGKDRATILAHLEDQIHTSHLLALNTKIAQRAKHIPLAYIRERAYFYNRELIVSPAVLVPRPESEAIIDILKSLQLTNKNIADIGTGSGCLGVTAALEVAGSNVDLYDIDNAALKVASKNADRLNAKVELCQSDLLLNLNRSYDVLLANLPYVPNGHPINQAARHEPRIALFAGNDGLDLYRRFWNQVTALPTKPAHIITESLPSQHQVLRDLALRAGYKTTQASNFVQHFANSA